jgi:hypothetical protein
MLATPLIDASKTDSNLDALCKNEEVCIACATECENILTWNIAKNVQMFVNVQQNVKLCLK